MPKIIVFGASGQLGQSLKRVVNERGTADVIFLAEESANILDKLSLKRIFNEHMPEYCINSAAYTAVDKAEDEQELADKVNREGVSNLSSLCSEHNTILIHISTDFVFSGKSCLPLVEDDEVNPANFVLPYVLSGFTSSSSTIISSYAPVGFTRNLEIIL